MEIIKTECGVVQSWCSDADSDAISQIKKARDLPFVVRAALMADGHSGYSLPIGGVAACRGVLVPEFVGYDGGCGMCAIKTSLMCDQLTEDMRVRLRDEIERVVPMGEGKHNSVDRRKEIERTYESNCAYVIDKSNIHRTETTPMPTDPIDAMYAQVGTLGGGNHFIEIQRDIEGYVWIMIHTGSRNIGHKIATYYNKQALKQQEIFHSSITKPGFIPTETQLGKDYIKWMHFATNFAFLNRRIIMDDVKNVLRKVFSGADIEYGKLINIHHNYASMEKVGGEDLWVHRKGATDASAGTLGIIPGDMGSASYIVEGLGNTYSMNSCSHGAGRKFGRSKFNAINNSEGNIKRINDSLRGIIHSKFKKETNRRGKETGQLDVSEAPDAYKDIESVMNRQKDLVRIVTKLLPLVNVKG